MKLHIGVTEFVEAESQAHLAMHDKGSPGPRYTSDERPITDAIFGTNWVKADGLDSYMRRGDRFDVQVCMWMQYFLRGFACIMMTSSELRTQNLALLRGRV
jgi:hypothetical protein